MKKQRSVAPGAAAVLLAAVCAVLWLPGAGERLEEWRISRSGIPDAVSSRNGNGACYLTVTANSDEIVDEEEFAETVVRMCVENSFRSMKLSTDLNGYPESLDITVYLKKSDIGKEDPVLRIRFEPPEETEARSDPAEEELGPGEEHTERRSGYNIKDDADHYTLTVEKW